MIINLYNSPQTSSLLGMRRSNPKLSAAIAATQVVDLLDGQLAQVIEKAKDIEQPADRGQIVADIEKSISAGQGLPDDLMARYTAATVAEQAYGNAAADLHTLAEKLRTTRDMQVQANLDLMCEKLNEDLQRVYAALRKLGRVPATAEQAIEQDKAQQFMKSTGLRTEYFQIREAQRAIHAHGYSKIADEHYGRVQQYWPLVAQARNLGAIWPDLPEWRRYGKKMGSDGIMIKLTPPWPNPDKPEFLDWMLSRDDAEPWVPTLTQAGELLDGYLNSAKAIFLERSRDKDEQMAEYDRRVRMWGRKTGPTHVIERKSA